MSPWRKRSNSSHLEQAEGHDEDCTERGEGTNCETSGATSFSIRVGWSGVRVVLSSALDGSAWVLGVDRGGTRRGCGVVGTVVGGVAAGCRSGLILFLVCVLRIHLLGVARGRGRRGSGACLGWVIGGVVLRRSILRRSILRWSILRRSIGTVGRVVVGG